MRIKRLIRPRLPSSRSDPVSGWPIVNRAFNEIRKRYRALTTEVITAFERIPAEPIAINAIDEFGKYRYVTDSRQLARLTEFIASLIDEFIGSGRELNQLWLTGFIEEAYRKGTSLAVTNLSAQSATYATERSLNALLFSEPFQRRIGIALLSGKNKWKKLETDVLTDLSNTIANAVAGGKNPRAVVSLLKERLGVSQSQARTIAQTEITGALRQARRDEAKQAAEDFGFDVRLFWTSALIPTTRKTHAARHGKVYTTENVAEFYSRDGNIFNCYCAQTEVIIFNEQAEISPTILDSYKKELNEWQTS